MIDRTRDKNWKRWKEITCLPWLVPVISYTRLEVGEESIIASKAVWSRAGGRNNKFIIGPDTMGRLRWTRLKGKIWSFWKIEEEPPVDSL